MAVPTSQSFRVFVKAIVAGWDNCRNPMPRPTSCRTHRHAVRAHGRHCIHWHEA